MINIDGSEYKVIDRFDTQKLMRFDGIERVLSGKPVRDYQKAVRAHEKNEDYTIDHNRSVKCIQCGDGPTIRLTLNGKFVRNTGLCKKCY